MNNVLVFVITDLNVSSIIIPQAKYSSDGHELMF